MAADGTKTMNAKLSLAPLKSKEIKPEIRAWMNTDKDVKKVFAKPIVYQEKIDLNPKKWNEGKLAKAMEGLVRPEMQLLANRISDIKKKTEGTRSPKEQKAMLKGLEGALDDVIARIQDKCSEALDELASGKGEAQAGIALGKKTMAKLNTLSVEGLFKKHAQTGLDSIKKWEGAKDKDAAMKDAEKNIKTAIDDLKGTGKDAQNVAKFLLDTGKKLKGHDNGQLAKFGEQIMKKELHPQLQKLDADMDKLEDVLTSYADVLSKGTLDDKNAGGFKKDFNNVMGLQATGNKTVLAMKALEGQWKRIEKDLK